LDAFKKNYQGALATAPTTRYDSSALQVGDLYFNTTSNAMFVRSASGWSPAGSSVNGTSRRYRYIATAAQTTFTGSDSNGNTLAYDSGFVDVYLNGSRLDQTDFTATSGSSIVLSVGANAGEELNIVAFGTFSVAAFDGSGLNAGTVSYNKIQNVTAGKVLGRDTSGSGVVQELPIAVDTSGNVTASGALKVQNANANLNLVGASNVAGTTSFDLIQAADSAAYIFNRANGPMIFGVNNATQARLEQSGDFRFNSGYGSVATAYGCRAWISMVGTGTISIRGSANVSSIVDDAVGNYTVNFTSAMPDTNYSAVFGANGGTAGYAGTYTQNTGSIKTFGSTAGGFNDLAIMNMAIFR
jgi:hypothetical protein